MFYLVSYDIVDDRRRARVHKLLKNYGTRVQYSVFECQLEAARLAELRQRLKPFLDTKQDSLRAYRLCKERAHRWGWRLAEQVIPQSRVAPHVARHLPT